MGPSENPTRIESEDRSCLRLRSGSFDFVFSLFFSFALFALSKARHHDAPTTPTTNVCLRRLIDVTSLREIKFVDDNTLLAFPFFPPFALPSRSASRPFSLSPYLFTFVIFFPFVLPFSLFDICPSVILRFDKSRERVCEKRETRDISVPSLFFQSREMRLPRRSNERNSFYAYIYAVTLCAFPVFHIR